MKKILAVMFILAIAVSLANAEEQSAKLVSQTAMTSGKTMAMEGTIIDNACATANKKNLATFIKTHPKSCALMPNCVASGYSIYTKDGKLTAFDKKSDAKIEKFLKKNASTLDVAITAKEIKGELSLVSIKNSSK